MISEVVAAVWFSVWAIVLLGLEIRKFHRAAKESRKLALYAQAEAIGKARARSQ